MADALSKKAIWPFWPVHPDWLAVHGAQIIGIASRYDRYDVRTRGHRGFIARKGKQKVAPVSYFTVPVGCFPSRKDGAAVIRCIRRSRNLIQKFLALLTDSPHSSANLAALLVVHSQRSRPCFCVKKATDLSSQRGGHVASS